MASSSSIGPSVPSQTSSSAPSKSATRRSLSRADASTVRATHNFAAAVIANITDRADLRIRGRIADMQHIYVQRDFGAVGNGTTDGLGGISNVNQVQMLQGGGTTITAGADTLIVTDDVAFVKDGVTNLVFACQFQNSAADNMYRKNNSGETNTEWYKTPAAEASTQIKSGYSDYTTSGPHLVTKVELLI